MKQQKIFIPQYEASAIASVWERKLLQIDKDLKANAKAFNDKRNELICNQSAIRQGLVEAL